MLSDALAKGWFSMTAGLLARRSAGLVLLVIVAVVTAWAPLTWLALAVAAVAFAAAALAWPAASLAAIGFAVPLGRLVPLPVPGADLVDLLVVVSLAAWFLRGAAQRRLTFRLPLLGWPVLILVWFAALSLTQAGSWREGVPEWLKWAEFAVVYLLAAQVESRREAAWVVFSLLLAGLGQVALGAYQFLTQAGPEGFAVLGRFMRAYGTFRQPNPYGGYLGYLAPIAASLFFVALGLWFKRRQRRDLWIALSAGMAALALTSGIVMSWSRGAWLGMVAALLGIVGLRGRAGAIGLLILALVVAVVLAFAGGGWLPTSIAERIAEADFSISGPDMTQVEITDANFSVLERVAHWRAGWRMFEDHPWLGVGIGNYAIAYEDYALPHWYEPLGHAHNVFVNFLAETGALGAGSFLVLWLGIGLAALRSSRRAQGYAAVLGIGVVGAWVYLTVHSLFDNLFVQHMQLQLALLAGLLPAAQER